MQENTINPVRTPQQVYSKKDSKTIIIILAILAFIALLAIVAFTAYTYGKNKEKEEVPTTNSTSETNEDDSDINTVDPYENWNIYEDNELGFSFKYPSEYTIDNDYIYDGIRIITPESHNYYLTFHINENPQFSQKVHKDNYELVTSSYNNKDIYKIEIYCTNQLEESDTYCSAMESISSYNPNEEKTLQAIMYTQTVEEDDNYYFISDFSKSRENFAIEIYTNRDKEYESNDTFKNLELIINSIEFI